MEPRPDFQFDPFSPGATAYDDVEADLDGIDWNDPASALKAIGGGGPGGLPFPETLVAGRRSSTGHCKVRRDLYQL